MNTMTHKGYTARVEYDERDNILCGSDSRHALDHQFPRGHGQGVAIRIRACNRRDLVSQPPLSREAPNSAGTDSLFLVSDVSAGVLDGRVRTQADASNRDRK